METVTTLADRASLVITDGSLSIDVGVGEDGDISLLVFTRDEDEKFNEAFHDFRLRYLVDVKGRFKVLGHDCDDPKGNGVLEVGSEGTTFGVYKGEMEVEDGDYDFDEDGEIFVYGNGCRPVVALVEMPY